MTVITRNPYPQNRPDLAQEFFSARSRYAEMLTAMNLDPHTVDELARTLDAEVAWLNAAQNGDENADALFKSKNQLVRDVAAENPDFARISALLISLIRSSRYDLTQDTAATLSLEERLAVSIARVEKNALMDPLYELAAPHMRNERLLFTLEVDQEGYPKEGGQPVRAPRQLMGKEPWRAGPLGKLHQKKDRSRS